MCIFNEDVKIRIFDGEVDMSNCNCHSNISVYVPDDPWNEIQHMIDVADEPDDPNW